MWHGFCFFCSPALLPPISFRYESRWIYFVLCFNTTKGYIYRRTVWLFTLSFIDNQDRIRNDFARARHNKVLVSMPQTLSNKVWRRRKKTKRATCPSLCRPYTAADVVDLKRLPNNRFLRIDCLDISQKGECHQQKIAHHLHFQVKQHLDLLNGRASVPRKSDEIGRPQKKTLRKSYSPIIQCVVSWVVERKITCQLAQHKILWAQKRKKKHLETDRREEEENEPHRTPGGSARANGPFIIK